MSSSVQIKAEGSVKWIDVNRKVLIDCLLEHSDGTYSNIKNKKSAWKLVVADFATKTGLSYDKKILASQVQSLKKTGRHLTSLQITAALGWMKKAW